jgi:protein TonB
VKSFWRNVVLIALAHIALVAGLIRWSVAAKAPTSPESIVWLAGTGNLSPDQSEEEELPPQKESAVAKEPSRPEKSEAAEQKPVLATAKSEIELPGATPRPKETPAKPVSTPAPEAKPTPKPISKPARNHPHSVAANAPTRKGSPIKPKPTPTKASIKSVKKDQIVLAKKESASQNGSGSTGKAGTVGGGNSASEFGWYGDMLHDRFYSAWIQPTTNVPSGGKISTLVSVRIEKDGRVSKFEFAKPSGNATVNESVAAVAKQVSHVDPPPTGLIKGDHYDVKINFELNTEDH